VSDEYDPFRYPDVASLAGRVAPDRPLDEAAADALADAIAAFTDPRGRAAARARTSREAPKRRYPGTAPIRTVAGWRAG
jgi:hypothetical protein